MSGNSDLSGRMKRIIDLPRHKNSTTTKLLCRIASILDDKDRVVLPWFVRSCTPMYRELEAELSLEKHDRRIRDSLRQLKRQRFIEIRKIGGQMEIFLTEKGEALDLIETVRRRPVCEGSPTLLVSFDIPEQERTKRNLFTRQLKYAGFKRVHASLWSIQKDVSGELVDLVRLLGAKKWIHVYTAQKIAPK